MQNNRKYINLDLRSDRSRTLEFVSHFVRMDAETTVSLNQINIIFKK